VDAVLAAGLDEAVHVRAGHVHRARPEALPELVEAAEGGGLTSPDLRRVERDERLRQHGELHAVGGSAPQQAGRLLDGRPGVEDDGGGLDGGDADGRELGHDDAIVSSAEWGSPSPRSHRGRGSSTMR
jgi:hypothetical protein